MSVSKEERDTISKAANLVEKLKERPQVEPEKPKVDLAKMARELAKRRAKNK